MSSSRACTILLATALFGCDNRQAFVTPEPGLERMLTQPRAMPYGQSSAFGDGRAMRESVPDTVARERPFVGQPVIETGRDSVGYALVIPIAVSRESLEAGRASFERICATCHGVLGDGHSVVAEKMELRKPPSLHEPRIAALPPGKIFEVVSHGYGLMPAYASTLSVAERWSVIAYLDALRASQAAIADDLPLQDRTQLARSEP
ncbi:MAG TPA: cytochrome c [Polyangiaceae bacterium]|jgi:mono/diheme cytochrome c family protein